jgi:hypothetical protein
MKIERWRMLYEVIGFLAVVSSILFLTLEVRQNTQAMHAAGIQGATDVARQQLLLLVADSEAHRIEMLGHENPEQLNPEELRRYRYLIRSFWLGMQGLFRQWQLGVLPEAEWIVMSGVICQELATSGVRSGWPNQRSMLIPEFVAFVDAQCVDSSD